MQASLSSLVQAQESGEHTQIVDEIVYAIDGLGPSSSKTSWQDNASTLAEICNTRRGRQAFRYEHNNIELCHNTSVHGTFFVICCFGCFVSNTRGLVHIQKEHSAGKGNQATS